MKYPKYLYRSFDGFRFTLQNNGKYTMDKSEMRPRYEYTYRALRRSGFVDSLDKCIIERYLSSNDGHGDID